MTEKLFVIDNKRERKMHELYLNSKGADVYFVFDADTNHPETVPAHRIILSLDSPVFDTMFFGSIPEKNDVTIVDASAATFKEFLQFFYLNEVHLSSENIVDVTNLCKKYEVHEFLKSCEIAFQSELTMNDLCWGYSIALLLEQGNLIRFCEQTIKSNAKSIMKSESFLECDSLFLNKILTLVSSHWSPLETVIACMEWGKAQCKHNNLDTSSKNLRDQLESVFSQIPFHKLTAEQFGYHIDSYTGFFTGEEFEKFFKRSLPKHTNPFDLEIHQKNSSLSGDFLECDRKFIRGINSLFTNTFSATTFSSNTTIMLSRFYLIMRGSDFEYRVFEGTGPSFFNKLILEERSETSEIVLPEPVLIKSGHYYNISYRTSNGIKYEIKRKSDAVELGLGIRVTFELPNNNYDQLMKLVFTLPQS